MKKARYIWNIEDGKKIYSSIPFEKENAIELPLDEKNSIFVDILEVSKGKYDTYYKVKLFYADGQIFEGWTWDALMAIDIINKEELFDGRFNS